MNNFKMIYKILKYLEAMMDVSEPDMTPIRAEAKVWNIFRKTAL